MPWWDDYTPNREWKPLGVTMPKLYRKRGTVECERWTPGIDMTDVSISKADKENGSPRDGDMIAADPENPADRWLISAAWFKRHYEPF